ncbi:MAG: histidine kinase [Clostridia bacterium]|nr:histidine kinase [Clostridia bacterium]
MNCLTFKGTNCQNCYKCIRHCPVKSIKFSNGQANLIADECVLCGSCVDVCHQRVTQIADQTNNVLSLIETGNAIASVDPAFVAYFDNVGFENLKEALLQLGFLDAQETSIGARAVAKRYDEIVAKNSFVISSACPSVNLLIKKHFPTLIDNLAPVETPFGAHAKIIRQENPTAKIVYVSPCIASLETQSLADAVLPFNQLAQLFKNKGISVAQTKKDTPNKQRSFAVHAGIIRNLERVDGRTYMAFSGPDNCVKVLREVVKKPISNCFLELWSCADGCIGSVLMNDSINSKLRRHQAIIESATTCDCTLYNVDVTLNQIGTGIETPMPTTAQIKDMLKKMGKFKAVDHFNCGACGYNTCAEKAIAILQGKSEMTMCMPYLALRAERFSDAILDNTPNGIIVTNLQGEVLRVNRSLMQMMGLKHRTPYVGQHVTKLLPCNLFDEVVNMGISIRDRLTYVADCDKYFKVSIAKGQKTEIYLIYIRDVNISTRIRLKKEETDKKTMEIADQVVDRQMRIVQEIALLLGETAAETKVALTKLKESIIDENK